MHPDVCPLLGAQLVGSKEGVNIGSRGRGQERGVEGDEQRRRRGGRLESGAIFRECAFHP